MNCTFQAAISSERYDRREGITILTRAKIDDIVYETLAAETCSMPAHFRAGKVRIFDMQPDRLTNPFHRRFGETDPAFKAITTGIGGVISASPQWLDEVREIYDGAERDRIFEPARMGRIAELVQKSGVMIFGPYPRFIAYPETVASTATPNLHAVELIVGDPGDRFDAADWPYALTPNPHASRPVKAVSIATEGGKVIGLATIFADSAQMWQIGLDVVEEHRGKGLGTALTLALARYALESDAVPYYGATAANIPSIRTAISAGLKLAWMEVFSVPAERVHLRSLSAPWDETQGV
ncbi:MAG: GNAT family N-acetyltransferase [Chloroflexi bacterium]|nr:GNAT family N-acetyltransferase [Chloroflexota bacterium]